MSYYVVINGRKPGIYTKWAGENSCQEQVNKFPGAIYKSVETEAEAKALFDANKKYDIDSYELRPGKAILYVAGHVNLNTRKTGIAYALVTQKEVITYHGEEKYPILYGEKNGSGELDAVVRGLRKAQELGCYDILICHSYYGSLAWAKGLWQATSDGALEYKENIDESMASIHFCYVQDSEQKDNPHYNTVHRLAMADIH